MAGRRLMSFIAAVAASGLSQIFPAVAAEPPVVIVSTKPFHSLVAGVMAGIGEPVLMLDGSQSPHTYALKPSDAAAIEKAARVIWMGPSFEGFLAKPLAALDPKTSVELGARLGDRILPSRPEGAPEEHGDHEGEAADHHDEHADEQPKDDDGHDHGHRHVDEAGRALPDLHAWLDPTLAIEMVKLIAQELAGIDPEHATQYQGNAASYIGRLTSLDTELGTMLAPVRERPFVVFHDAYQYFGKRYDLHWAGALSVSPEHPPGARHLSELREQIEAGKTACVFAEPQFEARMVERLVEGTGAKAATLDPDGGVDLPPGPEAYFSLMRNLAAAFVSCLKG